jgi:arsenate reductase-like glutaredoxin family protein
MKKQEMSVDELAIIINKSFDHVEKRFNDVGKQFDNVNKRIDRLEQGQKEIKQVLSFTARKFEVTDLTSRVEKLEYKMAKMSK